jgi:hypothetical protein
MNRPALGHGSSPIRRTIPAEGMMQARARRGARRVVNIHANWRAVKSMANQMVITVGIDLSFTFHLC